jgi:hypothetical protein
MKSLVISLDFEMRWGVLDRVDDRFDAYRENLLSVRENIPWLLKIFEERGISATWATVGALACNDWDDFNYFKPSSMPNYENQGLDYDNNFNSVLDPAGEMYFAPDLIKKILCTPGQELGMHTFGHIYGTEKNVTQEQFICDIEANRNIFYNKFGVLPSSLVFPRNQCIHQESLLKEGLIQTFRGNEDASWYSVKSQREKRLWNRGRALIDSINPMVSYSSEYDVSQSANIKSSAMLRIHMKGVLRKLHLKKLKSNISQLKSNEHYHIWFHPHNIGTCKLRKKDFVRFFDDVGDMVARGAVKSENMQTMNNVLAGHRVT